MILPRDAVRATPFAAHGGRLAASEAGETTVAHDFSVCLNAFGPAPMVAEAVRDASIDEYPDPRARAARAAAAAHWRLRDDEVLFAAGSAELIHAACFTYLNSGDVVLIAEPAFGEYRRAASLCGAKIHGVPTLEATRSLHELTRRVGALHPRLVFVASPVSPIGVSLPVDELSALADACARIDALLVLDQAYDAFIPSPRGTPALRGHSHVLHLRSLTKDHALAGVRAAFGVGDPGVIADIERVRLPWAASSAAHAAAIAAMTDAAEQHVLATTSVLRAEAERIAEAAVALGLSPYPSDTHYLTIDCHDGRAMRDRLLAEHGILVRDCTSFGLPRCFRVAARLPAHNELLITALTHAAQ